MRSQRLIVIGLITLCLTVLLTTTSGAAYDEPGSRLHRRTHRRVPHRPRRPRRRPRRRVARMTTAASVAPAMIMAPAPPASVAFAPACSEPNYPSPSAAADLGIDQQCNLGGNGGAEAEQNDAKNNFCAGTNGAPPQPITIAQMRQLQARATHDPTINFGDLPAPTTGRPATAPSCGPWARGGR